MRYVADLHIHSYLSRATSKELNLEGLHRWAQRKGITVVGTGDFTHPRWLAELAEKLVPAEDGLFALRDDIARSVDAGVPPACRAPVRFMLSVEVSSIYKRGGKVRKVHNLLYAPTLDAAARIAGRLGQLGNIASDGRPILGVDSRDVLEITLESSPDAFLIPAHVWTPWFSALGAQSGFDRIADCYADLAGHIFAVETGLSSDPAMNWRISELDRFALVSSSDAHSPEKLGREASLFDCDLSYFGLRDALRERREGFLGTVEFFPEEGKYHWDGHRKCDTVVSPGEARERGGVCPACGKPLTRGVMSRVEELADRAEGFRPDGAKPFWSLVPLAEVLGELGAVGPQSKAVRESYERLLSRVGPELGLLMDAPMEELDRAGPPLLGEAVRRVRAGDVHATPGYDGEYGVVRVFEEEERRRLLAQRSFGFSAASAPAAAAARFEAPLAPAVAEVAPVGPNPEQTAATAHGEGPLLIVAGPGTGKTRVVVERISRLLRDGVSPRAITAISFTRKAAAELGERLGATGAKVGATTFHAFGLSLLRAFPVDAGLAPEFVVLDEEARRSLAPATVLAEASWAKAHLLSPPAEYEAALAGTRRASVAEPGHAFGEAPPTPYTLPAAAGGGTIDFDDLVARSVRLLETSAAALAWAQERTRWLFVDEYQDVNAAQVRLISLLASPNLCAVGDPDQAIYGFRGADPRHFHAFSDEHPGTTVVTLAQSYRCPAAVTRAATWLIERSPGRAPRPLRPPASASLPVERYLAGSEREEAAWIAAEIERAVGGTSLYSIDAGRAAGDEGLAFHDVAVLYRTNAQADALAAALDEGGLPYRRADGGAARRAMELLAQLAVPLGAGAAAFRDELALLGEADVVRAPQKVTLCTLHAAKGLEFALVFVVGCEDGLLPLRFPGMERLDREEERRLLYVGMTRAKSRLVLTAARRRTLFGRTAENDPCPFLRGAPPELFVETRSAPRPPRAKQLSLL